MSSGDRSDSEDFGLYLVLTNPRAGYERCAEAAVEHRVRYVQLRMKDAPFEDVLRMAERLKRIVQSTTTKLIVNDDPEVAIAADADGVHLGQEDMRLEEAKRRWGVEGKVFGLSTHDERQAERARADHPSYIGVGPVFPTPTKAKPDPVLGVARAASIVRSSPIPCVAIGGIDDRTLPEVLAAGIRNFAVVRFVGVSERPADRIRTLVDVWRRAAMREPHLHVPPDSSQ